MPTITVEGKPTLFFSTNDVGESWRLKEKIIAVLESYLQGFEDLYTFSSIKVPNIVGDPTEVDVAFSSIPDPTEFFRFVQIRDRRNTEGRPWIEQVMGQQRSLGIRAAAMVSTERFSRYAIRLASNENIPLRLLRPETSRNIKKWYRPGSIGFVIANRQFIHAPITHRYKYLDAVNGEKIAEAIVAETEIEHLATIQFRSRSKGQAAWKAARSWSSIVQPY